MSLYDQWTNQMRMRIKLKRLNTDFVLSILVILQLYFKAIAHAVKSLRIEMLT